MQEIQIRCQEDPLEKEMATHSSILARKPRGQRSLEGYSLCGHSQTRLSDWTHLLAGVWVCWDDHNKILQMGDLNNGIFLTVVEARTRCLLRWFLLRPLLCLCPHMVFPCSMCYVLNTFSYKDTSHIRLGLPVGPHFNLKTSKCLHIRICSEVLWVGFNIWMGVRAEYNFCCCFLVAKSSPTLCDSMDCNLPGSSVHGISQAKILEWVVISFSTWSSWPRDLDCVSCIGRQILYCWTTWKHRIQFIP